MQVMTNKNPEELMAAAQAAFQDAKRDERLDALVRKTLAWKKGEEEYPQTRKNDRRWAHPAPAVVASPSLEDALRERPTRPGILSRETIQNIRDTVTRAGPTTMIYHGTSVPTDTRALTSPLTRSKSPVVVSSPMWTAAEYRTYERLTAMVCAPVISERARAQVWLKKFVEKHGKDKCEMMLAEIRRRDEAEWFKDKMRTKGA